jgi:hypothetical protein
MDPLDPANRRVSVIVQYKELPPKPAAGPGTGSGGGKSPGH